jgi:hypothetical protein
MRINGLFYLYIRFKTCELFVDGFLIPLIKLAIRICKRTRGFWRTGKVVGQVLFILTSDGGKKHVYWWSRT